MAIWNSERIQRIRKAVIEDRMETVCNLDVCPHALEKKNIVLDQIQTDDPNFMHLIEQIRRGETRLDRPPLKVLISDSGECNLACVMCTSNNNYAKYHERFSRRLFGEILPKILPYAMRINLTGNGDPFFRKETRAFLMDPANTTLYPNLKIDLVTNGLLLNEHMWEKIRHNRFHSVNISCDGATPQTYEDIRVRGKWNILQQNLKFISSLRKKQVFNSFSISYVVIKRNHHEIVRFIDVMSEFNPDEIRFQRVTGYISVSENINFTKDIRAFAAIGKLLEAPQFKNEIVNARALEFYSGFKDSRASWHDRFRTWILIKIFSVPLRYFYTFRRHLVPYYHWYHMVSVKLGF